jgi:pimeloyl-ACP methyl ester carboxylesterase
MYTPAPPVIVIHGLWLNGLESFFLRERLRAAGFAPEPFRYHSMQVSLTAAADALAQRLRAFEGTVHVVAHSLGGLITCEAFDRHTDLPPGRVVLLGSPVRGARAAREVAARWYGATMLGPLATAELARERDCTWQSPRELGIIAGSRAVGLGRVFADLPLPNDGTVCVDETRLPGAAAHRVLDVSHTGMLMSSAVAAATIQFLASGSFEGANA